MSTHLGEFEQLVLLALLRLGEEAYGVAVQKEIASETGRRVSFATVYTTLARLEVKGFVATRQGDPTPERGGRRKKYFEINALGKRTLKESLRAIRTMARGLDASWDTL